MEDREDKEREYVIRLCPQHGELNPDDHDKYCPYCGEVVQHKMV